MNDNPLVLTFDFGTQSVRTSLVNKNGEIEAISKIHYEPAYYSLKKGYAEQSPDFYVDKAFQSLEILSKEHHDLFSRVIGATVTTFRDTAVLLDENNKPIRDSILWLDQRMAQAKEKIPFIHHLLFFIVGMTNTVKLNRKRTIAHWVKENEPENWKKVKKYVNLSTYIIYKLTGLLVDSSASYAGHYPINFKKVKWYKNGALKGRIFGIDRSLLPEIKNPGEILGTIKDDIAKKYDIPTGIKLYASGTDKGCETIGLGALSSDTAAISYGTACTVEVSNQKYHEPESFLPAYQAAIKGWYNMEVQIYRGYWMLTWFAKNFASEEVNEAKILQLAAEEVLNEKLKLIPPGSDGLVLQPYWGPGLKRPLAKGSIVGFSDIHTKVHLYRAIIEGIAYALKEGLESIQKSQHKKVKQIMISGGGSQSNAICQITADIFGLPVSRVQTYETTTLGASIATFIACGVYKDYAEAKEHMVHTTDTFYPNKEAHQKYLYLYKKVYLKMYPNFKTVYRDLKKYDEKY
ncbi:MAG: FGGY-family carbohydrate kinase [Bacilli bacterium]